LIKGGIDTAIGTDADRSLLQYPLLILGAAALQGFFRYFWRINIHGFSRRCEADLRDRVFTHLQKLPLNYFQYMKTGDLMSRLTNDIQAVRELMGFGSLAIVDAVVVIVFSLTLMITIDPWLTLWSMMAMPLIPVVKGQARTAKRDERLRAGKFLRYSRGPSVRAGAKTDSWL
jgi:ATP-binding cassette, subfamily B, multidrug efflux pump